MTALDFGTENLVSRTATVLETERLVLRPPRLRDAGAVAKLANDRRVAENAVRMPHPYRLDDATAWIATSVGRAGQEPFVITLVDGTVIGACGLEIRDESVPELGYWLGAPYWGHGFATEAVRAALDHAFGAGGLAAVQAGARVANPASRRVLEKCGFQWSGVALWRIRALNSSAPIDRFRLERKLWASLKAWGRMKPVVSRVS